LPIPEAFDVRILADDLTGALDSGATFADDTGIHVAWRADASPGPRTAVDLATREAEECVAVRRHAALASWLSEATLSFKKIDSLLRGHVLAEMAACIQHGRYERVIVAPAFPFQGRVTRGGRQWRLGTEDTVVGPDPVQALAGKFPLSVTRPEDPVDGFMTICDAETDTDLDRIVSKCIDPGTSTLWVGSGGLAAALARHLRIPQSPVPPLVAPLLALVGTDHAVTRAQLEHFSARFPDGHIVIDGDVSGPRQLLAARLRQRLPSVISVAASGSRRDAAIHIDRMFAALLEGMPSPGVLLVTGGETLHALCDRLEADALEVHGQFEPGLPISRICGGPRQGLPVISKSGAFGALDLLTRIAAVAS
jgi:uncharacterized protein YgbK (DUF1537 family)